MCHKKEMSHEHTEEDNRLDFKEQHMSVSQYTVSHFYSFLLFYHEVLKP